MSEYQYYEFLALDKPLTRQQQAEVRAFSTRASISSTRFVNEYHWGNFKGDPVHLLAHYYDVMLYFANWGTRRFMVAYPGGTTEAAWWRHATKGLKNSVEVTHRNERIILDFSSDSDEYDDDVDYFEEGESSPWLAELLPLREDIMANDPRVVCLLQLAELSTFMPPVGRKPDDIEEEELKWDEGGVPVSISRLDVSVPAGLTDLPPAYQVLKKFLRVHPSLLATACQLNPGALGKPTPEQLSRFVAQLGQDEKDRIIGSLLGGEVDPTFHKVRRRWLSSARPDDGGAAEIMGGRLLGKAYEHLRRELHQERERKQQEAERALRDYESGLRKQVRQKDSIWTRVEGALDLKPRAAYDEAIEDLKTLHDISIVEGTLEEFLRRLDRLSSRYVKRTAFRSRLSSMDFASPRHMREERS